MLTDAIAVKSNTDLTRDGKLPAAITSGTNGRATVVLRDGKQMLVNFSRGVIVPVFVRMVLSKGRTTRKMVAMFDDRSAQ